MQSNHRYIDKVSKSTVQTNPRYKNFTQSYYTVGDSEQFWVENNLKKQTTTASTSKKEPHISKENIFRDIETFIPFSKYQNTSQKQVEDTFNYIFHKFKKGIFIKIRNGQLEAFIPFSKANYTNEWSEYVKVDPKYQSLDNFFKVHNDLYNKLNKTSYRLNINKINLDPSYWYANNCIFRYENPVNEGDTNHAQLKSMFLELCSEREVPDIDLFINKRDFPILTRNATEPYDHIFGDNVPLKSFKFDKYIPILGMCTSDKFADIAIPTFEDWARVKSKEGVSFPSSRNYKYNYNFNLNWESKKSMAVFRGSNTGCGYNDQNNVRLKLAKLGRTNPYLLDVGITNWNLRIRKHKDSPYLQIPDVGDLNLVGRLSPEEQSNYKFLIDVDGHVSAFRLSLELSMGSCILLVKSSEKWKMWYSDLLEPYIHYVPVKSDLSDLMEQLKWCLKNDLKCKAIAQNALIFYKKYLSKKGILDNLQKTIFELKKGMGETKYKIDPLLFQMEMEHDTLVNESEDEYKIPGMFPKNVGRNYGSMKGLETFVTKALKKDKEITYIGVEVGPIFKSKTTRVTLYQIGAEYVVGKKTTRNSMKMVEFIHEAFIGKKVMNNLLKFCPNFVYTLAYRDEPNITYLPPDYFNSFKDKGDPENLKEVSVLQEYIKGPTLQEFLKNCTFKSYLEVVLSLFCSLSIAQNLYGFVHHDLKPWNIIVTILQEPIIVEYLLRVENDQEITYKIKTKYIPVIIDYGKSHVIFNNIHYGIIEPFSINKNIDLITLLISTVNEFLLKKDVASEIDIQDLLHVINFISKIKINNTSELKAFIIKNKKFGSSLNNVEVNQNNSKNIFEEFFKYITPLNKKYKVSFGKSELSLNVWSSNPRQIVDVAFKLELEDKIDAFLEVPRRIYVNPLPQAVNRFTTIMIAQKLFDGLSVPKMEFLEFAAQNDLSEKQITDVLVEYNKIESFIQDFYTTQLNKKIKEPFKVFEKDKYESVLNFNIKPTRGLFLDSTKPELDIKNLPAQFPDYFYYRTLIMEVLRNRGPFKMNEDDKKFYMDNFKLVFDENYISAVVDIETIRFYENL